MIVTPDMPWCSYCRERVPVAVQFFAYSGEHGAFVAESSRGAKRSVRLCRDCLDSLSDELREAERPIARRKARRKA